MGFPQPVGGGARLPGGLTWNKVDCPLLASGPPPGPRVRGVKEGRSHAGGGENLDAAELLAEAAEALTACDVDAIVPLYADDGRFEDVPTGESYRGHAAIRRMFEALFSAPHTRFRVVAARPGEGWGVIEWVWSGRTRNSGTAFDVRGVSVLEISGSEVTKETIYYDPAPARV